MGIKTNKDFGVYVENIVEQDPGFKASATLDFKGTNPSDGNYLTLNGTQFTFKDSTSNATDVSIGSDISATLDNLLANSNLPDSATYTKVDTDKLFIEYKTIGDSGNNYTLACDFVTVPSSLSGGTDVPDPDWVQFDASINFKPIELLIDTSDTTVNNLYTYNYSVMKEGNKLLLTDSGNNIVETTLGSITESGALQTLDPNHIGSRISLDSTNNIATRNADSSANANSQIYGYEINKGNVYWEVIYLKNEDHQLIGISTDNTYQDNYFANVSSGYGYHVSGEKYNNNTGANYGDSYGIGDIIGIRYCYETGELEFYKNGVSQGIAYTLAANTTVYPAIRTCTSNSKVQMISDPKDMKYLPDDCVPYGMLKYSADISGLNLNKVPTKAFLDNKPLFLASMEPSKNRVIPNIVEKDKCILHSSTKDELHTSLIYEGEELLIDGNDVQIDSTKLTIVDTINDADLLEDGSQVAGYTFDNVESGGNVICMNDSSYNGQWKTKDSGGNIVDTDGSYDAGKFGNAASFDGDKSNYISVKLPFNNFYDNTVNNPLFLSLWAKLDATDGVENNALLSLLQSDEDGYDRWYIDISNKSILNETYNIDNIWRMYYIEFKADEYLKIYVDRKKIIDKSQKLLNKHKFQDFLIGGGQIHSSLGEYSTFNGLIDQVRIFNRPLIEDEISILYNEQKAKYDISDLNLSNTPTKVISKGYIDLVKDSSDTSSFTGLSPYVITIDSTDNLITDKGLVKPTSSVTIEAVSNVDNYDPLLDGSQIAGYKFEDSDSSGNVTDMNGNFNGQWYTTDSNGNPVTCDGSYDVGKFGNASKFDGNHYIETGITNISDVFTISLWFKGNTKGNMRLIQGKTNNYNFSIDFNTNVLDTTFNSNYALGNVGNLLDDSWHFVLFSVDRDKEFKLIVDNNLIDTTSSNYRIVFDDNIVIGAYNASQFFTGLIDQVRIFNKVLDQLEIQALYNEQIQKYTIPLDSASNAYQFCKIPQRTISSKIIDTTFDGTKFTANFDIIKKQGRDIQRRIIMHDKYLEVLPPFKSNMWKKG